MTDDVLSLFQPAVLRWFVETFAEPTPPQALGCPRIAAGENTLILSPTGSGKTLAAFLCAIDSAMRGETSLSRIDDEIVLLNVNDPANVFGDLFPILRPDGVRHIIRHHPGNYLMLENGHPLVSVEHRCERLITVSDLTPQQRAACFQALGQLVEGRHRNSSIRAMTWDGSPIVNSLIEEELAAVGFIREDSGMILYRTFS